MGRDPETLMLAGNVKKWEVFPGRNRFCCDGRVMLSTQTGIFYFTLFLIVATSACFFGIDAAYLWIEVNPVLPILAALQFIFVNVVLCRTACGDPGVIPRASPAEAAALDRQIAQETSEKNAEAKQNNQTYTVPPRLKDVVINGVQFKLKYCYTCKIFRPPRASHCSVCDNCVDRFDHHCPWVGNCVGRRNYKYFYLFLASLTIYCLYLLALSVTCIVLRTKGADFATAMSSGPLSPVVALIAFFSIWSVAGLAGFHTHLIGANMTTNEDIKGTFKRSRGGQNPFSAGSCCKNFISVLCGPLPPSLIDRRGLVSNHDVPPTVSSGSGITNRQFTSTGNTGVDRGTQNRANHSRVNNLDTSNTNGESSTPAQSVNQRNTTETSQISNGKMSSTNHPKYLPPIETHLASTPNREFLT